jgi:hypothetical protein
MINLPRTLSSKLSLIGFAFAIASGLLAASSILYARAIGGFPYYDPLLLRIFAWGFLLSSVGLTLTIIGALRPSQNRLRFLPLICAAVTLIFWLLTAMGE